MLFLPGQLSRRADFYHQLAQMTAAGLGITATLRQLQRSPGCGWDRARLASAAADIEAGSSLSESFRRPEGWLPEFDLALLRVGEGSGRLDATFAMLASYYGDRAVMARRLLAAVAYPALLVHLALFLLPVAELFQSGNLAGYLLKSVGVLAVLYLLVAVGLFLAQTRRSAAWRRIFEFITGLIPLVGAGRRELALGRLAAALEALISAGENLHQAWPLAAAASGSPALQRAVDSWRPLLAGGRTPADVLRDSPAFPTMFADLYHTGEVSGTLDQSLRRLSDYYADEGSRHLHLAARIGPGILYALVAAGIAWRVVQFYLGYFDQINQAINGT